jgi:glucokinase
VEAYASGTALIKRANFLGKKQRLINAQKFTKTRPLFESAKTGYPPAITAIREGVEALTSALASLINTLDPACAVIGGGVMFGYLNFWSEIEAGVSKKAVDAFAGKIPILPAKLGNMAGLAGAALAGGRGG